MDIYVIKWEDGTKEEYRYFWQFCGRIEELETYGYKKDRDFTTYQMWF
ncbi:MAG: hypothetical protein J6Y48_10730 [Clostridia bacterium]|nr:hypothetical protein [Clostridia bacterium]